MQFFNSEAIAQAVKFAILVISFFMAISIVVYNWIYLVRVFSSHHDTDLHPPKNIGRLVKASIFTALFTVVLIVFFFAFNLY
jgi:hypothetical protein